jgi:outer membrane protein OmpA-like peptidoglycan-associated protein
LVPNAAAKQAAIKAALTAKGPGGPHLGGVTKVDASAVSVGAAAGPFRWRAEKDETGLKLFGSAPSEAARARILAESRVRFPKMAVRDQTVVATGAPGDRWTDVALDALRQLAKLDRGQARIWDQRLFLIGEGEQAAVAEINQHYSSPLPAPFIVGSLDLSQRRQDIYRGQPQSCQQEFNHLLANRVVEFRSGDATIDAGNISLLRDLAKTARLCDRNSIRIQGFTDDVGEADFNLVLSQRRAANVRFYLIKEGVAPEQLIAEGFGEAGAKVPNTNEVNRARNRRIEFKVQ